MQAEDLWQRTKTILRKRMSPPSFETWVKPSRAVAIDLGDQTITVETPNEFARDWISKNLPDVHHALNEAGGAGLRVALRTVSAEMRIAGAEARATEARAADLEVDAGTEARATSRMSDHAVGQAHGRTAGHMPPPSPTYGILNPKYTFETFVVGNHSRFAHAAAIAVAENPAKAYNPLFIYGGVGLGKTHLMHAIGHHMLARNPHTKVAYLSSEKFTNELINSIKEDRMPEFRTRYRNIDLLLIDDIQFIEGKGRTEEEFFHTFNALYEAGKQIVLSSDRPPKDLKALEDRLRSRFEWGLLSDIQTPDLETRMAILKKKADSDMLDVDDQVIAYIATAYQNNVRELEGAFIRVMAYASLTGVTPTVDLAMQVLGVAQRKPVTMARIREIVADHFHLSEAELIGQRRTKEVSWARQVAMYLSRELTDSSLPTIGGEFGGRDHTTVLHAWDKVHKLLATDTALVGLLQQLTHQIKG